MINFIYNFWNTAQLYRWTKITRKILYKYWSLAETWMRLLSYGCCTWRMQTKIHFYCWQVTQWGAFENPERDFVKMTDMLHIPCGIGWSIVLRYQLAGGEVVGRQRSGRMPVKVDGDMRQHVVRLVKQHPSYTSHQLNDEMWHELPNNQQACRVRLHTTSSAKETANHPEKNGKCLS